MPSIIGAGARDALRVLPLRGTRVEPGWNGEKLCVQLWVGETRSVPRMLELRVAAGRLESGRWVGGYSV